MTMGHVVLIARTLNSTTQNNYQFPELLLQTGPNSRQETKF